MRTRIQKWGNSLALRVPKAFADELGFVAGTTVEFSVEQDRLLVSPASTRDRDLSRLLARVTPENMHTEMLTGKPVGRETW